MNLPFSVTEKSFTFYHPQLLTGWTFLRQEAIDVFGPIPHDHRATPEPTQDYGYDSQLRRAGSAIEEDRKPAVAGVPATHFPPESP